MPKVTSQAEYTSVQDDLAQRNSLADDHIVYVPSSDDTQVLEEGWETVRRKKRQHHKDSQHSIVEYGNGSWVMNLHNYKKDEAKEVVRWILDNVNITYSPKPSIPQYFEFITGKGNGSKGNISVLKPAVKEVAEEKGKKWYVVKHNRGRIRVIL